MESKYKLPITADNLVYATERFTEGNSPNTLYFPSKLLLFKIMKACIGVKFKEHLWF
jgi:hypothetical protein